MGLGDHELVQGCFKGLTTLLHYEPPNAPKDDLDKQISASTDDVSESVGVGDLENRTVKVNGPMMVLNTRQMKALVLILHSAVLDATHQTSSFNLVKALVHQKVIVSEM